MALLAGFIGQPVAVPTGKDLTGRGQIQHPHSILTQHPINRSRTEEPVPHSAVVAGRCRDRNNLTGNRNKSPGILLGNGNNTLCFNPQRLFVTITTNLSCNCHLSRIVPKLIDLLNQKPILLKIRIKYPHLFESRGAESPAQTRIDLPRHHIRPLAATKSTHNNHP